MNELELLLLACKKSLEKMEPTRGVKVGEDKMKYNKALKILARLDVYFRIKGAFSFGICKDCTMFDRSNHQSIANSCGTCKRGKGTVTIYDTCDLHSSKKGDKSDGV